MKEILQDNESREQHRLILNNIGGISKTQLAITYAQCHRGLYKSIFWLNAMSKVALKMSLRLMAEQVMKMVEYEKFTDKQILLHVH
jgi:hypothetical protein